MHTSLHEQARPSNIMKYHICSWSVLFPQDQVTSWDWPLYIISSYTWSTVKPRPEAHMDMILSEVFLKNIHLIPQDQIVQWHVICNINSAVVISVVVESSRCSSKTFQKRSCPYAPLDEALQYTITHSSAFRSILILHGHRPASSFFV